MNRAVLPPTLPSRNHRRFKVKHQSCPFFWYFVSRRSASSDEIFSPEYSMMRLFLLIGAAAYTPQPAMRDFLRMMRHPVSVISTRARALFINRQ